jgi:tetratricopeptide (TPR) repeat protein
MDRERTLRSAEKNAARGRYKQAIEDYETALEQTPRDARLLLKIGDLHARNNAYAWAVDTYARAARVYTDEGFAAKAVAVYKQILQLFSTRVPHLADFYLYVYPTLAGLYQELRLSAEAVGTYDAYASLLARSGRLHEAAAILRIVAERGGDNPITRLRLAEVLLEDGCEQEALEHFRTAADRLVALDRTDEALRVLDRTHARTQAPDAARHAARILLNRGRTADGMQALLRLQQAFQAQPKNLETLDLLARAFEVIDQKDRAFEVRKETVRIAKDQGAMDTARAVLAVLHAEAPNDPDVAALTLTIAPPAPRTIPPSEPSIPEVSVELVEAESSVEHHAVAVEDDVPIIEEAGSPPVLDLAGEIAALESRAREFVLRGDLQSAIHTVRIGLELDRTSEHLRSLLEELLTIKPAPSSFGIPAPVPSDVLRDLAQPPQRCAGLPPVPSSVLLDADLVGRSPLESIRGFRGGGGISEALEEAEFFVSRGLFDDALAIVREQMVRSPNDPVLVERADDIEQMAIDAEAQPSVLGIAEPTEHAARVALGGDADFLQAALADMEAAPSGSVNAAANTVDVDSFFLAFKQGIAAQVEEQDSRMHYDLGLAYLEMGQVDGAIETFRKAAKDPARACVSLSMIASAHQRAGDLGAALEALQEAAAVERKSRSEEAAVHYEIASLHEARGEPTLAVSHFEHVVQLAPDFRDARARLESLRRHTPALRATVVDEEIEHFFDDLIVPDEKR